MSHGFYCMALPSDAGGNHLEQVLTDVWLFKKKQKTVTPVYKVEACTKTKYFIQYLKIIVHFCIKTSFILVWWVVCVCFDEDLGWICQMLPYSKRHLVVDFKKCTLAWNIHVMRFEQAMHFVKKGRPLLKKDMETFQTIQTRSGRPMFEKRSGMCSRSTFWLSFEAMFEMALLVMSPYFCVCLYVCVRQTDVYKKQWTVYGEMYLQLLQVCFLCVCAQKEKYLVNHSCFSPSLPLCSRYGPLQTEDTHTFIL